MRYELSSTETFNRWICGVDEATQARLGARLVRIENGNFGDYKVIAANLFELRCFFGGGLRVYYTIRNQQIVLLLAGGDKSTQSRDIARAKLLLSELED